LSVQIPSVHQKPIKRVILERLTTPRHVLVAQAREENRLRAVKKAKKRRASRIRRGDIEARLKGASFPIRSKDELISELGGVGTKVGIRGSSPMNTEEIADLCFAEKNMFFAPGEVSYAVDISSWARATIKSLNGVVFPLVGPGEVLRRVGNVTIDGVKIDDLARDIRYPLKSSIDLIEKLVECRNRHRA
jgi:hypothetical protein